MAGDRAVILTREMAVVAVGTCQCQAAWGPSPNFATHWLCELKQIV